jgi:lysozyme family protein
MACHERLAPVVVDTAVNMGVGYAVRCMQTALNLLAKAEYVVVDGEFGPQTRAALKTVDPSALAFTMCAQRLAEYGRRGKQGDVRRVFLDGWINRVRSLMELI